ncbi:CDK-activating kinase assembly factor [Calocera viscosa TUFC12733]|uniref:RNA polymerase II transcription factor B subunit 3 n=1 Tax=Calocera viscosa (strain TUFC12733) TaxID=1330018 RepID=A0A167Q3B3_CALVF|nr:CDK-activating kinase assembly factor [Calocera viscosa TUFC12733]
MASNPKLAWLKGPARASSSSARPTSRAASKPGTPGPGNRPANLNGKPGTPSAYHNAIKDPSGRMVEYSNKDDKCPVCTTDRYLNPKLRLLVSPCYHKMCESCIDRLFTLGPAPCPICGKILRKSGFVAQTFEDLDVEKEVSVRRRIAREFNKKVEDFPDRKSYDDYLEEVEDITFNLINGIDIPQTEARIAAFRAANAALIEANIQRDTAAAAEQAAAEEEDRRFRTEQARMAAREEEEERAERERERRAVIDGLERGEDAEGVLRRTRAEAERRARRAQEVAAQQQRERESALTAFARPGARKEVVPDEPHIAYLDELLTGAELYTLKLAYDDPVSEAVRPEMRARWAVGGFRQAESWQRAVSCAVMGLGMGTVDDSAMEVDVGA